MNQKIKFSPLDITIEDLVKGLPDDIRTEEGIWGYNGRLNIRPPYQREFVYKEKERNAVIASILKGFPLNTMYWADDENGNYELLDGQQRTTSICLFFKRKFSIKDPKIRNGKATYIEHVLDQFLEYPLQVSTCVTEDNNEKMDWFETINIAGKRLKNQEILNAVFSGPFVNHARELFSKSGCNAIRADNGNYLKGNHLEQDYLETALKWISNSQGIDIDDYMGKHQQDKDAYQLWDHFETVIKWLDRTFKEDIRDDKMKGQDWGQVYEDNKHKKFDPDRIEERIKHFLSFEKGEITKLRGIWPFVLYEQDEEHPEKFLYMLQNRSFEKEDKERKYEEQGGLCANCGGDFELKEMHGDHKTPWIKGGTTTYDNLQMLCAKCNGIKGAKEE